MNDETRKTVRQRLSRQQQINQALEQRKEKPYMTRWGLTPDQIRRAFDNKPRSRTEAIRAKRTPGPNRKTVRPPKATRGINKNAAPRLLLEVPATSILNAVQYPTPPWFTQTEKVDVSVIVPLFKSKSVLKDLIDSWDLYNSGLKVEMIFVDDCCPMDSKNAAIQLWTARKPQLKDPVGRVYHTPVNQGFGTSCNTGAYHAKGEYLIFLNADTIVTKDWIRPIVRLLKKDDIGIVGNLQIKKGGQWTECIDGAGSEWHWEDMTFHHIGRHVYKGKRIQRPFHPDNCPADILEGVSDREMVTGCCIGIRKKVFQELGGFNPNYRIGYWEDSDLCLTAQEAGYRVVFTPFSKIWHKLSHSNAGGHKYQEHNRNYFLNKWVASGRIDKFVTPRKTGTPEIKNILIKRETANGDVLAATGVAAALKKKHPGVKVWFNTGHPNMIADNPHIDGFISNHEISERRFQVYYNLDMAYELRPYTNIMDAYAAAVGVDTKDCEVFLKTEAISGLPDEYITLHAYKTNWVGRDWSMSKFDILAKRLIEAGHNVVSVGGPGNHRFSNQTLDLVGKTSVYNLAYVIQNAKLHVGMDSFPMHIAQAFNVPGVCFFGSVDPKTRIYRDNITPVVARGLKCLGCHHRKPAPCTNTAICETQFEDCVNQVSVDQMMQAIEKQLEIK